MDRQTLRDWVIRFNEQGPEGLINIPSPGMQPKLDQKHGAFSRSIVEEGPRAQTLSQIRFSGGGGGQLRGALALRRCLF